MSLVEITLPETPATCPAGSQTLVELQVTSLKTSPFHIGARLTPDPQTPGAWLSLSEPAESRLIPGQTITYTASIAVPEDAITRDHRFRVLFFDMAAPGEDFVETPDVRFDAVANEPEKPAPEPVAVQRRGWIESFFFVLLVVAATLISVVVLSEATDVDFWAYEGSVSAFSGATSFAITLWGARRMFPLPRMLITSQMIAVANLLLCTDDDRWAIISGVAVLLVTLYLFWRNLRETAPPTSDAGA